MKNTIIFISFFLMMLFNQLAFAEFTKIYDLTKDPERIEIRKSGICSSIHRISNLTSEDLSRTLKVSDESIHLMKHFESADGFCCIKLDTPRGVFNLPILYIYRDNVTGNLFSDTNTVGVTESDPHSLCAM